MSLRLSVLFICLSIFTNTIAQVDIFSSMDSTFNAYVKNMDDEYTSYTEKMDEDFYKYLMQDWDAFTVLDPLEEESYSSEPQFSNTFLVKSVPYPVYTPKKNAFYEKISFKFFEERITLEIDAKIRLNLKSASEREVAEGWKKLTDCDFGKIIEEIGLIKSKLHLNDWAVYCLVHQVALQIFPTKQYNEKALFISFILAHAGYDIRLGRIEDKSNTIRMIILLPFRTDVYKNKRTKILGKYYYIEPLLESFDVNKLGIYNENKIYSYKKNFELAKADINLSINRTPLLGSTVIQKSIENSSAKTISKIRWKKGLTDFYNTYPRTLLPIYLNTPLSPELKESLYATLKDLLNDKNKKKATQEILKWFFYSFPYKSDEVERTFFAEQTVLYDYSDCEDRAILFARIIKELLQLNVALFVFDGHVATGVCFETEVSGFSKSFNVLKYTICDPSSKVSTVGYIMDEYSNNKVTIVPLHSVN
ncbi:hypothetical protein CLV62_14428 [Dysgonomonas alginatilytica]|uniref:Transglutaminase superfamily protein n=1 Tax=Dysgonomonas alginatilytica TaxID=1605892 RepID=A0A2V3PJP9_9BACT|nr:hypothetical protein [Dysgonomonas alginatilytica]PXV58816.1 hypothetical protein CLV62_14428 [Dysgonomonas alginatilytica]